MPIDTKADAACQSLCVASACHTLPLQPGSALGLPSPSFPDSCVTQPFWLHLCLGLLASTLGSGSPGLLAPGSPFSPSSTWPGSVCRSCSVCSVHMPPCLPVLSLCQPLRSSHKLVLFPFFIQHGDLLYNLGWLCFILFSDRVLLAS